MLSHTLRRALIQLRVRLPHGAATRALVTMVAAFAIVTLVGALFFSRVRPIVAVLAKAEAREYVLHAINDAVEAELATGSLRYNELVSLEKDASGAITALITDMAQINLLQSRVSNGVAVNIVNVMSTDLAIPLGNVVGGIVFSGRGPRVPIRVESVTDISTEVRNDFSSSGINQTRHKITLAISAEIVILIPGGKTEATVATELAIAETIIVGTVPNVYVQP